AAYAPRSASTGTGSCSLRDAEQAPRIHEREAETRSTSRRFLDLDAAAVVLRDLSHDRKAEPRPRLTARALGTVEAVEADRLACARPPGAGVAARPFPAHATQLDAAAAVAPLGGVLDEVPDRPLELLGIARDRRRLGIESQRKSRKAGVRTLDDAFDQPI